MGGHTIYGHLIGEHNNFQFVICTFVLLYFLVPNCLLLELRMARAQKQLLVQVPFDVGTSRVAPCTRKRAWSEALHAAGRRRGRRG